MSGTDWGARVLAPTDGLNELNRDALNLFRKRAAEFLSNWNDLKSEIPFDGWKFTLNDGAIDFDGPPLNVHRVKGLLLDFRVFTLQQDDTHFEAIMKKVNCHFRQPEVRDLMDRLSEIWNTAPGVINWSGHNAKDFLDIMFYGWHFHAKNNDKLKKYRELSNRSSQAALYALLLSDIKHRQRCIFWLNTVLEPFAQGTDGLSMSS